MTATADMGGPWRPTSLGLLGDERLARHAGAGDAQAFAIVYERYHHALYRYCRSILRNDADAQDALQSTFASAFAALRTGQRDAPMRPWLFRIAHNESISALRRRRPAFELSAASEQGTASVEDEVAGRAEIYLLLRDLRELTDRQRSALVLRELSGLSHEEIAIALGTTVGGAKQMIFEARRALFEFAQGRDMACGEIRRTISDADGRTLRARRVRAHLRECTGCASFAAGITTRTEQLHALAPVLPAATAAGLLARLAISHAGRAGGSGLARLVAAAAGKSATVGAGFGANALAGVAVVATATVGVTVGVDKFIDAISPAGAAGTSPPAGASHAKATGRSSSPSVRASAGARSAGASRATGTRAAAHASSAITLRMRSTGSAAGPGLRSAGAGVAAWPRSAVGSARAPAVGNGSAGQPAVVPSVSGQAGAATANSGADAAGRDGSGKSAAAGSGNSHSARSSSSSGSGTSTSSGTGRHGSGGSGHGSGNSNSQGAGQSASTGSANSNPAGSGNSKSTGSGRWNSGGSGKSHSAGSGPPPGAGGPHANANANANAAEPSGSVGAATNPVNTGTNTVNQGVSGASSAVGHGDGAGNAVGHGNGAGNGNGADGNPASQSNAGGLSLPAPALLHGHHPSSS